MRTLKVQLGERSYPIHIGAGVLGRPELFSPVLRGRQVLIVSNETVAPLFLPAVRDDFPAGFELQAHVIPDGERYKTLGQAEAIFSTLMDHGFGRDCCIVALGGGVVGDVAGFVAACYQRGVDFIQMPTTLLAQVDSAIGGKTAVNHPLGKNMIGCFHQPVAVVADTAALRSLPDRQFSSGMAEVIKYGLIRDAEFFFWLEQNMEPLLRREPEKLEYAIERCCLNKASVVAQDEREQGMRALLNLGHTFGHAIEAALHYEHWLHGEAVACGMVMAAHMSVLCGHLSVSDKQRIQHLLSQAHLPVALPAELGLEAQQLLSFMQLDKKVRGKTITLVLLDAIGKSRVTRDYDPGLLMETLRTFCSRA